MAETPLRVDPDELRAAADRVDRNAHALIVFRPPDVHEAELPGSAVTQLPGPVAARFDRVCAALQAWAGSARRAADRFERSELDNAARLSES